MSVLAWLIETRTTNGITMWWSGWGWTTEAYCAIWFCRKIDAETIIASRVFEFEVFPTEHMFETIEDRDSSM